MRSTYSSRQGRRHLYYVCRSKKADAKCQQEPVASVDLEPSVIEQLKPILGPHLDKTFLRHSLERLTYDARTREVVITLLDRAASKRSKAAVLRSAARRVNASAIESLRRHKDKAE